MNNYEQQAKDFLKSTGTTISFKFLKHGRHFTDEKETRDIYKVTLKNAKHRFSFNFGQSIANQGECPTEYDVLACIQKYDVGSIEDFCSDFGYPLYNECTFKKDAKIVKLYNAVCKEYKNVSDLFTDEEIELLSEIN